jgi:hypothetical protein
LKCLTVLLQEFVLLRNDPGTTQFFLDLLCFIENKLLRMDPNKRAKCDEIVDKFRELHTKCSENEKYCTERKSTPTRTPTKLSELVAPRIPTRIDKQINRNQGPQSSDAVENTQQPQGLENSSERGQSPAAKSKKIRFSDSSLESKVNQARSNDCRQNQKDEIPSDGQDELRDDERIPSNDDTRAQSEGPVGTETTSVERDASEPEAIERLSKMQSNDSRKDAGMGEMVSDTELGSSTPQRAILPTDSAQDETSNAPPTNLQPSNSSKEVLETFELVNDDKDITTKWYKRWLCCG